MKKNHPLDIATRIAARIEGAFVTPGSSDGYQSVVFLRGSGLSIYAFPNINTPPPLMFRGSGEFHSAWGGPNAMKDMATLLQAAAEVWKEWIGEQQKPRKPRRKPTP